MKVLLLSVFAAITTYFVSATILAVTSRSRDARWLAELEYLNQNPNTGALAKLRGLASVVTVSTTDPDMQLYASYLLRRSDVISRCDLEAVARNGDDLALGVGLLRAFSAHPTAALEYGNVLSMQEAAKAARMRCLVRYRVGRSDPTQPISAAGLAVLAFAATHAVQNIKVRRSRNR